MEQPLRRPEVAPASEVRQDPKVLVRFHGWFHDRFDVQGVKPMITDLRDYLERPFERKVVYMEYPDATPMTADGARDWVRKHGFVYTQITANLSEELGRLPSPEEVRRRIELLSRRDVDGIVSGNLLPYDEIQNYYLYSELDKLRDEFDLDVRFEAHSRRISERSITLVEQVQQILNQMGKAWKQGDFPRALESVKASHKLLDRVTQDRDGETGNDVQDIVRKLLRGQGGLVFIIYGESHSRMLSTLQRRTNPRLPIRFEKATTWIGDMPEGQALGVKTGEALPDQLYAQVMLQDLMRTELELFFGENNKLSVFANNWETIYKTLGKLALDLSLDQIRELCEQKRDLTGFLQSHPRTEPIRSYLT